MLLSPKLLGALTTLIITFNLFAFKASIGLGLGIFFTSIIISFLILAQKPFRRPTYTLAATGIVTSLLLAFRANGFVQTINILTVLASITALFILHATKNRQWHLLETFAKSLLQISPKKHLDPLRLVSIASLTTIVILVFGFLLAQADPLFQKTVLDLFKHTPTSYAPRIFLSLLIATAFSFFITLKFEAEKINLLKLPLTRAEIVIPLSALIGLFALFLFIQAKYLFIPQDQFLSLGVTYSEYVRRGFKELMFTSALAGIIIYFTTLLFFNLTNMDLIITRHNFAKSDTPDLFYPSILSSDNGSEWLTIVNQAMSNTATLTSKPNLNDEEKMRLANTSPTTNTLINSISPPRSNTS